MSIQEKIISSKEIIDRAIAEYQPYAVALMLSGGDDSLTSLAVAKYLNVPLTHIIHGITGTGIKETTSFVRDLVQAEKPLYLEANAGDSYLNYVLRKGFFGVGDSAHDFSYHVLKLEHFKKTVSRHIRQRKRNRNVLFVNGGRRLESERRKVTMVNPIKVDGPNVWVNIINEWEKHECKDFLDGLGIKRNPVSVNLCRSGECMCGTMQDKGDRTEASYFYPDWGKWIDEVEKAVKEKGFSWGWGEQLPKALAMEKKGQLNMFQPMCVGCKAHQRDKAT